MKILTVIGARPQFIKAAAISRSLNSNEYSKIDEVIVHTGQHYDDSMSQSFFKELNIPTPKYNLEVGSDSHGRQTGAIISGLESVFELENPDWILVYGDTNSTLGAALVAAKKPCRLAHVEAGLRSYRWGMPEEVNRIVTDRLSDLLFCPTKLAKENLIMEGRNKNVLVSGDVMLDNFLYYKKVINNHTVICEYDIKPKKYLLATIHREENTDDRNKLSNILSALQNISKKIKVILPIHPRTKKMIRKFSLSTDGIEVIGPASYLTIMALISNARAVVTDSGGLQKESYFAKIPCLTIRDETEWIETLENGWNKLVSTDNYMDIVDNINEVLKFDYSDVKYRRHYGSGNAAKSIIDSIVNFS
ncbi:UDP-N-acetylglucosamine 2-epimerase (non-hydrolyzing) [bacterium]|nr:UDP-N-acetylglucosamine 2-epimerase (non-hydrolyzing) [bacterium]